MLAWANTSGYRARACYAGVAEFSVYMDRAVRGVGAGKLAMLVLLEVARKVGYWQLLSRIFLENVASRALLRSLGFREVEVYERHAQLDGIWRDCVIVEKCL